MPLTSQITFVVAANDRKIYEANFLASPLFRGDHRHEILDQWGFRCASKAYNNALDRAKNELVVFAHQDVYFPEKWLSQLQGALDYLEREDPFWGVLGSYGRTQNGESYGHVYSTGRGVLGAPFDRPMRVQTLDELVLILRRSSGLRFDERLPDFHFYGADICLAAVTRGMQPYAISSFCIHNTRDYWVLPPEFYQCYWHIKKTWKRCLPIQTTMIRISQFDVDLRLRRLKELYLALTGRAGTITPRASDPRSIQPMASRQVETSNQ